MSKRKEEYQPHHVNSNKKTKTDLSQDFINIAKKLSLELKNKQCLKKVPYVYNPTVYASLAYECYFKKYCNAHKEIMFLGINPGPWGMSQTGVCNLDSLMYPPSRKKMSKNDYYYGLQVPFGEVNVVKNWLQIDVPVSKPTKEHPARPVHGFSCQRSEVDLVSGKRFWGLVKELCGEPSKFFKHCFVYNYLPLQLLNSCGKNIPPTALNEIDQKLLFDVCDKALLEVIVLYKVKIIVAIGNFAETRAKTALDNTDIKIVRILHPSPQSKAANNWHVDARKQLDDLGITPYLIDTI